MPSRASVSSLLLILSSFLAASPALAGECVVLLHGLWRTDASMNKMERRIADAGYVVHNIEYDSTEKTVESLAAEILPQALDQCGEAAPVHFVTHSMGGILVRHYLEHHDIPRLGRVVMMGPPNQGSEVIDRYGHWPTFEWFSGPAGLQLGTGEASLPRQLGPVHFEVGIIAGTQSINPILSTILPEADDGKVSVDATRVEGMSDHIEMPVTHVFMMRDDEVIDQALHVLGNGEFNREVN